MRAAQFTEQERGHGQEVESTDPRVPLAADAGHGARLIVGATGVGDSRRVRGNRAGRSPVGCGHRRCVVIVSAHRPRRLVEHLTGRTPATTGTEPPGAGPAPEKKSEESQEQGDCPFGSFHGDSFQGVWEYLPRI